MRSVSRFVSMSCAVALATASLGGCVSEAGGTPAPVAVVGPDRVTAPGTSVELDGSASYVPGVADAPLDYAWTATVAPAEGDLSVASATGATTSVSAEVPGLYVVRLVVTHRGQESRPAYVNVRVFEANLPPAANAGPDVTVDPASAVMLDGTGSRDPNGDALTYAWRQVSGPAVTLDDATSPTPGFTAPRPAGNLSFALTVTDERGLASAEDSVVVTVADLPPVAVIQGAATADEGAAFTLDGTASADPNGDAVTAFAWSLTNGLGITLSDDTVPRPTFTVPRFCGTESATASLTVTAGGQSSAVATHVIQLVDLINEAPTADAGGDRTAGEGVSVTLDGAGSADCNGDALTYQWSQASGPAVALSDATAATPAFTTPVVVQDTDLVFNLLVNDGRGQTATDQVTITVTNDVNEAPIAEAGPPQTVPVLAGVTLAGSATDPNPADTVFTFAWTQTAGPGVTLSDATDATPTFTAPANPTTLTFSLVVSDGTDVSVPDTVDIVVTSGGPDLTLSTIAAADASLTADGVSTTVVTVRVVDAGGNPLSGETVVIVTDLGTLLGGVVDQGNGNYTQTLRAGTVAGTATLTFTVGGSAGTDTDTVVFEPGPPDGTISLLATPASIPADGTTTSTIDSAPILDANGNVVADGTLVTVSATQGTILTADADGVTPGLQVATAGGVISFVLQSETFTTTATVTATSVAGSASGTVQVPFAAGLPSGTIPLVAANTSLPANGTATTTIDGGPVLDSQGNPVADGTRVTVVIDAAGAGGTILTADLDPGRPGVQVETTGGTFVVTVEVGTTAGTMTVNADSVDGTASGTVDIDLLPGPASGTIVLTPAPVSIVVTGTTSPLPDVTTVTSDPIVDAFGNVVADGTLVTVSSDLGTAILAADASGVFAGIQVTTTAGVVSFDVQSGTAVGIATVTASSGSASGSTPVTVLPGPQVEIVYVSGDAQNAEVGTALTNPLRVQVRDTYGNGVPGVTVDFSVTAGGGSVLPASDTTDAGGFAETVATVGTVSGTDNNTFEAAADDTGGTPLATSPIVFTASADFGPAASLVVAGISDPTTAGASETVTVTVVDQYGNVVTDYTGTVTFTANDGGATLPGDYTFNAGDSGTNTFSNGVVLTRAGSVTVTVTDTADASVTGAQTVDVDPGAPDHLEIRQEPTDVVAGVVIAPQMVVVTTDVYGNRVNPWSGTLTAAFDNDASGGSATLGGTLSQSTTTGATTFDDITVDIVASGYTLRFTSPGVTGVTSAAFDVTPAAPAALAIVTPPQTVAAPDCSGVVTVEAQDGFGNASPVAADTTVNLTRDSGTLVFHDNAGCSSPVTDVILPAAGTTVSFYFTDPTPGTPTVTVDDAAFVLAGDSQLETIVVGPAAALFIATPPQTVTAGACSGIVTVLSRDAVGNTAPVAASTTVELTSDSGTLGFYSDASCTNPVGDVTIAASGTAASFFFRDDTAGSPTVSVDDAAAGLTGDSQLETIDPDVPVALFFTTPARTIRSGTCSSVLTVETRDTHGNVAPAAADITVNLSSDSGTLVFYDDATCTSLASSVVIGTGTSDASFYFSDTPVGTPTVFADDDASVLAAASQQQTVDPAPPSQLVLVAPGQTVTAGACSAGVIVETRDPAGNTSPVTADTTVNLTSDSGTLVFYSDSSCTAPIGSVVINNGNSDATFYFVDTTVGTPTTDVEDNALVLTGDTVTHTVDPDGPAALVITTAAQSVTAGACSGVVTVETRDSYGNVSTVGADTTVVLESDSVTMVFYSDSACTAVVTQVEVLNGTSSADFYFDDSAAGTHQVDVRDQATVLTPDLQLETITADAPAQLAIVTGAQTVNAGQCSGVVAVETQDAFGNASNVAVDDTLNLTSDSGTLVFYSDATCSTVITTVDVLNGTSSAAFYFADPTPGSPTINVNDAAGPLTGTSQQQTIQVGGPTQLTLVAPGQTVTAGACSAGVIVESQDAVGNPANVASDTTVNLTSDSGTLGFYDDASCTSPVSSVVIGAGTSFATFYFLDQTAGTPTTDVEDNASVLAADTVTHTVDPDAPAAVFIVTAPQTVTAGACSGIVTVETRDTYGNVSSVTADTDLGLAGDTGTMVFFTDAGCTLSSGQTTVSNGSSTADFYFIDVTAGTTQLDVTDLAAVLAGDSQLETIDPDLPDRLAITTLAQTVDAGACSGVVTVEVRDQFDNPSPVAANDTLTLSSDSVTTVFYSDVGCTTVVTSVDVLAAGSTVDFYFSDPTIGTPTLTVEDADLALTSTSQQQTIQAAAATQLAVTTAAQTVTAGACSGVVAVEIQDGAGNPATRGVDTTVNLTADSGMLFYSDSSCTTLITDVLIGTGTSSESFYFVDTTAGTPTITAADAGLVLTDATQQQTIDPDTPVALVIVSAPQTVVAGDCSAQVQVEVHDTYGNLSPITSATQVDLSADSVSMTFHTNPACGGAPVASVSIPMGNDSAVFRFSDTTAGTPTVTIEDNATVLTSDSQQQTIDPDAADSLAFLVEPSTVDENTAMAPAVEVEILDQYGNRVTGGPDVTIAIDNDPVGGTTLSGTLTVTPVSGVASFADLSLDQAGTGFTLTATSGALTAATSAAFDVTACTLTAVAAVNSAWAFHWDTMALSAAGSATCGAPTVTYSWSVSVVADDGTADQVGGFEPFATLPTTATGQDVDYYVDEAGVYTLTVVVDDTVSTDTDSVTVTVVGFEELPYGVGGNAAERLQPRGVAVRPSDGRLFIAVQGNPSQTFNPADDSLWDLPCINATMRSVAITTPGEDIHFGDVGSPNTERVDTFDGVGCTSTTFNLNDAAPDTNANEVRVLMAVGEDLYAGSDNDVFFWDSGAGAYNDVIWFSSIGNDSQYRAMSVDHDAEYWFGAWSTDLVVKTADPTDTAAGAFDVVGGSSPGLRGIVRGLLDVGAGINEMFVLTTSQGFVRYPDIGDLGTSFQFTTAEGLRGNDVRAGALDDTHGDLWMTHDNATAGVSRYKRDVNAVVALPAATYGLPAGITGDGVAMDTGGGRARSLYVATREGVYRATHP